MATSPFFLFKDPSQINFNTGATALSGNQLQGRGGFDPRIQVGGIANRIGQEGPGNRGIFFDGSQIGSTSERNVFEAPGAEGFGAFTSLAEEGASGTGMTGTGTLTRDPLTGELIIGPLPPGDSVDAPTSTINPLFDPQLTTFIDKNFHPVFGTAQRVIFRNLAGSGDSISMRLVTENPPVTEAELQTWFTDTWIPAVERHNETSETKTTVTGGFGTGGIFDIPSLRVGFEGDGGGLPLPGDGGGLPLPGDGGGLSLPGEVPDIDSIQRMIDSLNFQSLVPKVQQAGLDVGGVGTLAGGVGFNPTFLQTLGEIPGQLTDITGGLHDIGTSQVPAGLLRSLQSSQSVIDDLIGGSFGQGGPALPGSLDAALGKVGQLDTDIGNIPAPPDLEGAIRQALQLNEIFTLGGGQLKGLGDTATALRQQGGAVSELSESLSELGLGGLEEKIADFTRPGSMGVQGGLLNLKDQLAGLGIGGLKQEISDFRDLGLGGLTGDLGGLDIGDLKQEISDFTSTGVDAPLGGLGKLRNQLGELGLGGLEGKISAFEDSGFGGLEAGLEGLGLGGLEDVIKQLTTGGGGLDQLQQTINNRLGLGDLEDKISAFEDSGFGGLEAGLEGLGLGGLEDVIKQLTTGGGGLDQLQQTINNRLGLGDLEDKISAFEDSGFGGLEAGLEGLGLGGLEKKIADFTSTGVDAPLGGLGKLRNQLGELGLGGLEGKISAFEDSGFGGLEAGLEGLGLGGLEKKIADFTSTDPDGPLGGLGQLRNLLGELGIGDLRGDVGSFQQEVLPGLTEELGGLGISDLKKEISDFTRPGALGVQGGLLNLEDRLGGLGIGGLRGDVGSFQRDVLPGLTEELGGLDIGGLKQEIADFTRPGALGVQGGLLNLEDRLGGLDIGGLEKLITDFTGEDGGLSGLTDALTAAGVAGDPLSNILDGIRSGEFGRIPGLLRDAIPGLSGLGEGQASILKLLGVDGLGGQIGDLATNFPTELQKILDAIDKKDGGGGGGATDLTGITDLLNQLLAGQQVDTPDTTSPGGFMEDLLKAIRPDLSRPTTALELRQDPLTASILADQVEQNKRRELEDRELLSRFGVLRGGNTIDLANLRADDASRADLAALGQAATRADTRFDQATTTGTTLAAQMSADRLADAMQTGTLDGQRTLLGQDQDTALMSAIFSMLQKEFDPLTTEDQDQVNLVRSLMPLLPLDMREALEKMFEEAGFN